MVYKLPVCLSVLTFGHHFEGESNVPYVVPEVKEKALNRDIG